MALVLNNQGVDVSRPQAIPGLMYASLAPTATGWLAASSAISSAPELVALNATGGVVARRQLQRTTQAILTSNGDSDLIAWTTPTANFRDPRVIRTQLLTDRGAPDGPAISLATVTPSMNHPISILPVQATAISTGYIVGWQYQSRDTFSYRPLNAKGKPTGEAITYEIHNPSAFQPADPTAPALTLTSDGDRAWLWILGQISVRAARVVPIP
jgi:hypothetical protein